MNWLLMESNLQPYSIKVNLRPVSRRDCHKNKNSTQQHTMITSWPSLHINWRQQKLEILSLVSEEALLMAWQLKKNTKSIAVNTHTIHSLIYNLCLIRHRVYPLERWNIEPQICYRSREELCAAKRNKHQNHSENNQNLVAHNGLLWRGRYSYFLFFIPFISSLALSPLRPVFWELRLLGSHQLPVAVIACV